MIKLNANCFSLFIAKKTKNYRERKKNWRLKRRDIDKEVDRLREIYRYREKERKRETERKREREKERERSNRIKHILKSKDMRKSHKDT